MTYKELLQELSKLTPVIFVPSNKINSPLHDCEDWRMVGLDEERLCKFFQPAKKIFAKEGK